MRVVLGEGERAALGAAAAAEPRVRVWRRYRAILLLAEQGPEAVARALGCSRASVYGWAAAWRARGAGRAAAAAARRRAAAPGRRRGAGAGGAAGGRSPGARPPGDRLDGAAAAGGAGGGRARGQPAHGAAHPAPAGLALETAQVRPGAAGSGLRRKKDALSARAAAVLAAGGEVWAGDETTLREFPPLRAAWARRGQQAEVVISGRNARRVLHGLLNVATGERVRLLRERGRGPDCAAAVAESGRLRPGVPKLLAWDNAPPHHTRAAGRTRSRRPGH